MTFCSVRSDVYVGIDVFGRGCFGGGEFNCVTAMEAIRAKGLSAAIFAPGWTYEIPLRLVNSNGTQFHENIFFG